MHGHDSIKKTVKAAWRAQACPTVWSPLGGDRWHLSYWFSKILLHSRGGTYEFHRLLKTDRVSTMDILYGIFREITLCWTPLCDWSPHLNFKGQSVAGWLPWWLLGICQWDCVPASPWFSTWETCPKESWNVGVLHRKQTQHHYSLQRLLQEMGRDIPEAVAIEWTSFPLQFWQIFPSSGYLLHLCHSLPASRSSLWENLGCFPLRVFTERRIPSSSSSFF